MEKTIFSHEHEVLLSELKRAREKASLTQIQLAEKLGSTQSFISKVERGERRLDVIELREFCRAIGVSLASFVTRLEKTLSNV